jgi:competence protein ComEC
MPYLRQQGIRQIDSMVISHGDNDHRGGFESIQRQITIDKLYSGVPEKLEKYTPITCEQTIQWEWDGVLFSFLHPDKSVNFKKNDRSCVLRVDAPGGSILLTGDIHKRSERHLLAHQSSSLQADILVAPHHGSKTSSHTDFVKAVAASYVIFTSGYRNRFHHPHKTVVQRYADNGALLLDSASHGAIQFLINAQDGISAPLTYRQILSRHWSRD